MTDQTPPPKPEVRSASEIIKDVQTQVRTSPKLPNHPFVELAGEVLTKLAEENAKREALKTPEQKAFEARALEAFAAQDKARKLKKENDRLEALFKPWLKRDTWLLYDEAMDLNAGKEPEEESMFFPRDAKLWQLIQSCIGISLKITNPNTKPKEWRVTPFEWVRWLKEKDQTVNPKLAELLYPVHDAKPALQTTQANISRSMLKVNRLRALKAFSQEASERVRKLGQHWDTQSIPVTKADFLSVFKKEYPEFKQISPNSFDSDFSVIGIKFQRGTKSNKNNILKSVFARK